MWRQILVAVVLTAHGTLGQLQEEEDPFHASVDQLRMLARSWDAEHHGFRGLVVADGNLRARRLVEYTERGISEMCSEATTWVHNTASSLGSAMASALGIDKIIELFRNATARVQSGVEVAKKAWEAMTKLEGKLLHIFNDFKPLQPIFANATGLIPLITSPTSMTTLVHVIQHLIETSTDLDELGGFVHSVSQMFTEMSNLFRGALGKVNENEKRRLAAADDPKARALSEAMADYTSMLQNLDFSKLVPQLLGFIQTMQKHKDDLMMVKDILSPLMAPVPALAAPGERRLSGLSDVNIQQVIADQRKYARAVKAIVPTWQGIEKTGMAMCPVVAESNGTSGSLKCRIANFIEKAALPSWVGNMVSTLVTGCPEPAGDSSGCPTTSQSAGISDLLGKNAEAIGWVIAIAVAALGVLGIGVAGVVRKQSQGGDDAEQLDSEEESDYES